MDTARFRYPEWEATVASNWQRQSSVASLQALDKQIADLDEAIAANAANLNKEGFRSADECESVPVSHEILIKPYDVVIPEKQEDSARRICVKRVVNAENSLNRFVEEIKPTIAKWSRDERIARSKAVLNAIHESMVHAILPIDSLRHMLQSSGQSVSLSAKEISEGAQFVKDWDRWSASSGSYEPQLGDKKDSLFWGASSQEAAFHVFGPGVAQALGANWIVEEFGPSTDVERLGVIGAGLDAYTVCVEDNKRQLAIKYAAWEQEQRNSPRLAQAKRDLAVQTCHEAFQRGDGLLSKSAQLKLDRAQLQNQLLALQPISAVSAGKKRTLNQVNCNP